MSVDRRILFFQTPGAGGGRAASRLKLLRPTLERVPVRTVVARSFAEAADIVATLAPDEIPVAAGGDGTVNLLARALRVTRQADRGMVALPLGTGNAFAYAFGHHTVRGALSAIDRGRPQAIDVMTSTHPDFPLALISISAGFEPRMLASARGGRNGSWVQWTGLVPALLRVAFRTADGIELTVDDRPMVTRGESVYNVGLYNLPYYGLGRLMWPDAEAADGAAESVVCRSGLAYWRVLLRGLHTARSGAVEADPCWRRWRHARFRAEQVQIDGEVAAGGDFEVDVEPQGLTVLVTTAAPRLPGDGEPVLSR